MTSAKTITFLGSKPIGYECFKHLIDQQDRLNIRIAGILTRSRKEFGDGYDLTELATSNNIPVLQSLDELPDCDIIYSVQYHQILKPGHIAKAKERAVNLHMAPLPEYRGANQFSFAILDDKKEFGTTIHMLDASIDHGDILFQKRFRIPDRCWVNELYELTYGASLKLFKQTLSHIVSGNFVPVSQQSLINKYGTSIHYRHEMDTIKVIDPLWADEKIDRHIRATSMPGFEPPYSIVDGEKRFHKRHQP